jgi:hypothetical protein
LLLVHVRKKIITTLSPGFNFHKMIRYYWSSLLYRPLLIKLNAETILTENKCIKK